MPYPPSLRHQYKHVKGLFDIQVNGYAGVDFQRPIGLEQLHHACVTLNEHGVSHILATFITDKPGAFESKLRTFEEFRKKSPVISKTIIGYHLEGPYLSSEPGYCGAHPAELMKDTSLSEFKNWQSAANGLIRLVTLAPERSGSAEFISEITQQGVRVSLGHTNASDEHIDLSIKAGASLCTHLGNGCPAQLHRHDNIIQRLLARDELIACFIPDGIHLPPSVLKNFYKAKPSSKVIITTDAMAAAGAPPGRYSLAHLEMEVGTDQVVRMPGSKNFAGSALTLTQGIKNSTEWLNITTANATDLASKIPALALGYTFDS